MNDFQLTMLAAKAAGIAYIGNRCKRFADVANATWDPINDNADAFHLMTHLKLDIDMNERAVSVWVNQKTSPVSEEYGDNEAAAVRRAIVRAAALIGEAL
jgi:hypothetical protein